MSCIVGTAKMSGAGTSRRTIRSPATRHAGLPVLEGVKYLASRWIRQSRWVP